MKRELGSKMGENYIEIDMQPLLHEDQSNPRPASAIRSFDIRHLPNSFD